MAEKHIPALDGLRGLAVLLVVLHHATMSTPPDATGIGKLFFEVMHGGWMGVDIFFVLSGFLITGILYEAKESKHYYRNFYGRRVLRIFPIYYLLLAAVIVAELVKQPGEPPLRGAQAWYWLYLQNFKMAQWGDFGPSGTIPSGLMVTWSLAIEEQFYLLWPTVVFFFSRRALIRVCMGVTVAVFALRPLLLELGVAPITLYQIPPTRLDGLMIGALIALLSRSEGGAARLAALSKPMLIAGILLCIGVFIAAGGPHWNAPLVIIFGYALIALASGGLLLVAMEAPVGSATHRIFAGPALSFLGKYSYAMYLFHTHAIGILKKLFGLGRNEIPIILDSRVLSQLLFYIPALGVSILVSLASWHLVEKHCLRLKRHFPSH